MTPTFHPLSTHRITTVLSRIRIQEPSSRWSLLKIFGLNSSRNSSDIWRKHEEGAAAFKWLPQIIHENKAVGAGWKGGNDVGIMRKKLSGVA